MGMTYDYNVGHGYEGLDYLGLDVDDVAVQMESMR
jgi:hypothetical protein